MGKFEFPQYVMVYGTLKKGKSNHNLMSGSVFLGECITKLSCYRLSSGLPKVYINDDATGSHIRGELYLVMPSDMEGLDNLEGHPDWYKRMRVPLTDDTLAWMYIMQGDYDTMSDAYSDRWVQPDSNNVLEWN